ncbi:MAG: helix-turn-helix transcriptional regulator [Firmicutes bacterium]|nr:helix-turn-helix transcriptional regulator [Bacillota bacterium]
MTKEWRRLRLLNSVLKDKPIFFARLDKDLKYQFFYNLHPDFHDLLLIGNSILDVTENDSTIRLYKAYKKTLETGEQQVKFVTFSIDSKIATYKFILDPIFDVDGTINGIDSMAIDITDILEQFTAIKEERLDYCLNKSKSCFDNIGEKIKSLRQVMDISQSELARKSTLSQSYISSLERDEVNPTITSLKLIAKAINVDPKKFINYLY